MKTDSQIQEDVMQALKWDPSVTHEHIGVSVSNAIVTLSGNVPSYIEKWASEKTARRVAGVKAVIEKIEVKLSGTLIRDDQSIAQAIIDQFKWNVQVPDQSVKVIVENGSVELTGEVEWDFQRTAAERCVHGLTGVKSISNQITIQTKKIQADVIKKNIENALKREIERETQRISVDVNGNQVTLSGNVHSFTEMNDAKWAALSTPGVVTVQNNLHISNF